MRIAVLGLLLALAACNGPAPTPSPSNSPTAAPTASFAPTPAPTPSGQFTKVSQGAFDLAGLQLRYQGPPTNYWAVSSSFVALGPGVVTVYEQGNGAPIAVTAYNTSGGPSSANGTLYPGQGIVYRYWATFNLVMSSVYSVRSPY